MDNPLPQASAKTQTDAAYAALREAILSCRLEPGAKIKINDAAAEFEFSPGAVREALSRLAAERMAVATAQKGFTVAAISAEELIDLTNTRIAIEQLCLRSAIAHGDVDWEANILAAYHRLHRLPISEGARKRLNPAWAVAHNSFHAALTSACDSRWTLTIREMLYAQSERYRNLSKIARPGRDVDAEHKGLLDACLARDAATACKRIEAHLRRTMEILLASPRLATGGRA
ncbi:MAG: FCD domain-containing protein [Pseudomonadota bacterium]|nr:FCD domain-containing protein [Pseudomonadota bacterium]